MIGHEDEGLDAYARFVCTMVSGRSKTAAAQKSPSSHNHRPADRAATSPMYFSSLLTPLLEQIALIVSQHQPVVEKYYGPGKMLRVAVRLQEECDRQAASILSQWEEERRITKRVRRDLPRLCSLAQLMDIRLYRFPFLSSLLAPNSTAARIHPGSRGSISDISAVDGSSSADIEPREVDAVLAELAQMSGRWELYRRFLYARLAVRASMLIPRSSSRTTRPTTTSRPRDQQSTTTRNRLRRRSSQPPSSRQPSRFWRSPGSSSSSGPASPRRYGSTCARPSCRWRCGTCAQALRRCVARLA